MNRKKSPRYVDERDRSGEGSQAAIVNSHAASMKKIYKKTDGMPVYPRKRTSKKIGHICESLREYPKCWSA